jgi:hypothetical protein
MDENPYKSPTASQPQVRLSLVKRIAIACLIYIAMLAVFIGTLAAWWWFAHNN